MATTQVNNPQEGYLAYRTGPPKKQCIDPDNQKPLLTRDCKNLLHHAPGLAVPPKLWAHAVWVTGPPSNHTIHPALPEHAAQTITQGQAIARARAIAAEQATPQVCSGNHASGALAAPTNQAAAVPDYTLSQDDDDFVPPPATAEQSCMPFPQLRMRHTYGDYRRKTAIRSHDRILATIDRHLRHGSDLERVKIPDVFTLDWVCSSALAYGCDFVLVVQRWYQDLVQEYRQRRLAVGFRPIPQLEALSLSQAEMLGRLHDCEDLQDGELPSLATDSTPTAEDSCGTVKTPPATSKTPFALTGAWSVASSSCLASEEDSRQTPGGSPKCSVLLEDTESEASPDRRSRSRRG